MRIGRIQNDYSDKGFAICKEQEMQFIEICCNHDHEAQAVVDAKKDIITRINNTGIDVSCIGRWNHSVNACGNIDPIKADGYYALLDTAMEIGAKTFVCGCNYDPSVSLYKNYTCAINFFRSLVARAGDSGVKIAVQNCDWNNFIYEPINWDMVMGEVPELYLKYDPSHCFSRGGNYVAEISNYGKRIAHVHLKGKVLGQGKAKISDPPAGMDELNWGAIFAGLYSCEYDGDLSIEPHSAIWQGELGGAGVLFTRDFARKFVLR